MSYTFYNACIGDGLTQLICMFDLFASVYTENVIKKVYTFHMKVHVFVFMWKILIYFQVCLFHIICQLLQIT